MARLLTYRNDSDQPFGHVALDNGDQILVSLSTSGVVVATSSDQGIPREVLFVGGADALADICVSLLHGEPMARTTPLDIVLAAICQLGSAEKIRETFSDAVSRVA